MLLFQKIRMLYKTTNRLFRGIYQYKVVLVVPGAALFRSGDMDSTKEHLDKINISDATSKNTNQTPYYVTWKAGIKTQEDLDYAYKLHDQIKKLNNFDIRVESPFISIYSNSEKDINTLAKIDESKVKYISRPPINTTLASSTIVMPKMNYDYRITLGKTTHEHTSFITWAESNQKVKLTKSCIRDLTKDRSWGGTHFYITGDNNLLLAKMHLGSAINKVERIVKA